VKPSISPNRKKKARHSLRVLTGPVHSGKTTFLLRSIRAAADQGLRLNGILSLAFFEGEARRGYDALDLRSGDRFPLLRTPGQEGWIKVGPFGMVPDGFRRAEEAVMGKPDADLTVIDELGPLELSGAGFWPCMQRLHTLDRKVLVVIRETLLESFRTLFEGRWKVFRLGESDLEKRLFTV
jgi:nucleoside-triphosphatase THEP1